MLTIPEIVELAQTYPYTYEDVYNICMEYGEGYKEIITKHKEAGHIDNALEEMCITNLGCLLIVRELDSEIAQENLRRFNPF